MQLVGSRVVLSLCVSGCYYCSSIPQGRNCKWENWGSQMRAFYLHSTASACPIVALCPEQHTQPHQPNLALEDTQRWAPQRSRCRTYASACAHSKLLTSAVVVLPVLHLKKQTNSDLHVTAVLGISKEGGKNCGSLVGISLTFLLNLKSKTFVCLVEALFFFFLIF